MNNIVSEKFVKIARPLGWAGLLCVLVFLLSFHIRIIGFPHQLEYREGGEVVTTELLRKGINPFSLDVQPQYTNVYGIVYKWLMTIAALLFNADLHGHRFVTALAIWGVCALVFYVLIRQGVSALFAVLGSLIVYAALLFPATTTPLAGPHALGVLFFMTAVTVPFLCRFSDRSLMAAVVLGILAFYTKSYFVLSIVFPLAHVFLFKSKKRAVIFSGVFLAALAVSALFIHFAYDMYFNNCFFLHTNTPRNDVYFVVKQFKEFVRLFWPLLIMLILGWRQLIKSYWFLCLAGMTVLIAFWLGKTGGSWMAYLFQMMTPFLVIASFGLTQSARVKAVFGAMCLAIMVSGVHVEFNKGKADWDVVKYLLTQHQQVLNSPSVTSLLFDQGKVVYDSGHAEAWDLRVRYFDPLVMRFKDDQRLIDRVFRYQSQVQSMINQKTFDLILVSQGEVLYFPDLLSKHYDLIGSLNIVFPFFGHESQLMVLTPKR